MIDDPSIDPATGLLRNNFQARTSGELDELERILVFPALAIVMRRGLPGALDLAHLRAVHHAIFRDLYPWAGELRTVDISKPGAFFCPARNITFYADGLFAQLRRERHLHGLERGAFVSRASHYLAEINALHPFREGNGRAQRAFFAQLSREAGHAIDFTALDPDENIQASKLAMESGGEAFMPLLDRLTAPGP